jgi:6-phosphogluconolactonase
MKIKEFENVEVLESALIDRISEAITTSIETIGEATMLLSGGSTPVNLYKKLSRKDLPWSKIKIGLVDERYVPFDSEFSNERLLHETIKQNAAKDVQVIGMVYNTSDKRDNLNRVNTAYHEHFKSVTVCLLGMGGDGHTASLFPNDLASTLSLEGKNKNEQNVIYTNAPQHPTERITGNFNYLYDLENLILMLTGTTKKELFFNENRERLPIDYFKERLEVFYEL